MKYVYLLFVLDDGFKGWECRGVYRRAKDARNNGMKAVSDSSEWYVSKMLVH